MSSNFKLVSQLSRALGTDEDLTLLAVALVVISAGDHHVFGGVDLVVPGGSHPAQRQDLSAGLCCRLLRRLLPLPPSNLPRPRYSHLSGEDFFYHILITFPLYRLQLNTLKEWTIMRKNWEVSWVELNGFQTEWSLHFFQLSRLVNYMYWVFSLWTVKYRMHGTRVQGCSIIWSLGWFFRFTQSHSKNGMSVQIVLDGTLSSESVVPFVHCLLLLKMDPVCTYGNDLCQTKEDELGAKYQPDPLSSQLQSWPELVFRGPHLFCLLSCIFSGSVRQCTWKESSKRA